MEKKPLNMIAGEETIVAVQALHQQLSVALATLNWLQQPFHQTYPFTPEELVKEKAEVEVANKVIQGIVQEIAIALTGREVFSLIDPPLGLWRGNERVYPLESQDD